MYTLFDTDNNSNLLNQKLTKQLSLNIEEYASFFPVASSANAPFVRQLFKIKLQLHDSLVLMIEGIGIIGGAVDQTSIILKTDFLFPMERVFYH